MQPDPAPFSLAEATDGIMADDGTIADRARYEQAIADRGAGKPPAAADTPPEPLKAPDLNVPGLPPLDPLELPPDSLAAYQFPLQDTDAGTIEATMEVRAWMQQAGFPAQLGTTIANAANRVADVTGGTDAEFDIGAARVQSTLRKAWGDDVFASRQQALVEMVDHLDRKFGGKVTAFLDEAPGILLDPIVLGQLMLHAERVKGRLR